MTPAYDIDIATDTPDPAADLARDEAFATWCDEHRDAWIAETAETAEEVTP